MNEHRYILEKYTGQNSRFTCPSCGRKREFSRYIDTQTGEPLAGHVGKCNHLGSCGYHFTPKQYFQDNGIKPEPAGVHIRPAKPKPKQTSYIDAETFKTSLNEYDNNNLVKYLHTLFDTEQVNQLIKMYNIGTSARWNGGTTIFWQVDAAGRVRTGKLIKYDATTGKRIKFETGSLTNWVHSVLKIDNFNLKQCLFGEHLLSSSPNKTVGIVESEKTAIIASIYLPELLWLGCGGADGINKDKVKVLRGRDVILFPDASKTGEIYNSWKEKGKMFGFTVSNYLEKNTTKEQKEKGADIADFLVNENKPIEATPPMIEPKQPNKINAWDIQLQVPYNTPSPVAVIDSRVDTQKMFKGAELVINIRVFTTLSGDNIELVGLRSYGHCREWESHKEQNGYCRECLLNCLHTIKINGVLQEREYTQLEVLIMQQKN